MADDRRDQEQPPQMATGSVRLPSIQDPNGAYGPSDNRGWDPNSAYAPSPSYSPPSSSYPPDPRASPYYAPYSTTPTPYDIAYRGSRGPPGYPPNYPRELPNLIPQNPMIQSAPRQRTSIACRYCRRRKIRCSGYQNSPGGKCTNCIKMNQECVFQPVSSSSSTAFVPVSALPNGIPPGTQLFGAYGQPLAGPATLAPVPYPDDNPSPQMQAQPAPHLGYDSRTPPPMPQLHAQPGPHVGYDSRTPPPLPQLHAQPAPHAQPVQHAGYDNRTPPPRGSPSGPQPGSSSANSVMSLEHIVGGDIDQKMLGRLNKRRRTPQ